MRKFSRAAAGVVLLLGCAVLLGWVLEVRVLTSVVPDYNTMKVNTALSLASLAAVILLGRRLLSSVLLGLVGLLAAATLIEIIWSRSLGIDELVFQDQYTTGGAPGRMAPATASAILALVIALGATYGRRDKLAQAVLAVPLLVGAVALIGYLYDAEQLYRVASLSSVALHTSFALLLLAVSVLASIPDSPLSWIATGRGPGATVVRRTAPLIVVGLVLLGYVRMRLGDAGAFGEHFGIAIMVLVSIVIAVGSTVQAARPLDVADAARANAEQGLHDLVSSLREGRDEAWARAEEAAADLARERARFDRAISGTDSVAWTVETTSGQPAHVYASPNAERVLGGGLLPGETATAALARLVDADQRDAALAFRRCVREGIEATTELRLSVDGRARWLRVQGVPRPEGDRVFYDGVITDSTLAHEISEQREVLLLREKLQVEKLVELNRMRDEFIAIAGHELRTPVAVILGYLEMLSDPGASSQAIAEGIEVISRRAHQLNELVERVFDLARIDSGAMDLTVEPVQVAPFVDDLMTAHRHAAEAAGITLTTEVAPVCVLADRARLQQIFDNLLSNALKYTPDGGHVTLTVSESDRAVTFAVSDDGIGVGADELPRLFERLFRASTAREARIPGTGLGLAVTKALVEAQNGTMTAAANEPRGMVFRVTLPEPSQDALASVAP